MGGVECVEIKINKSLCVIDSIRNMLFFFLSLLRAV